jgi:cytochrome c oxidase assembly protein subunit 15
MPLCRLRALVLSPGVADLQEPENKHAVPRVSPYRLAAHLTSAFAIYATLVWTTLDLARPAPVLSALAAKATDAAHAAIAAAAKQQAAAAAALRARVLPLSLLVGVTAVSGAFVAGMDAGRAFNTFPLMNGQLMPDDYWGLPGIRNAFENTAAVQLHHRALALSTLAAVTAVWAAGRKLPLPGPARMAMNVTMGFTAAQVCTVYFACVHCHVTVLYRRLIMPAVAACVVHP